MGAGQRRKGGDGERELARYLRDLLGEPVERNLDQPRAGGGWGYFVIRVTQQSGNSDNARGARLPHHEAEGGCPGQDVEEC